ncbi:hypothetical protein [Undibacterium sp. Ren11W]|uniref:hypothetical protein n=1 Tax=Undibacterium sp. Ren11W TaxID=3413045 RepID=UPI003BF2A9A4
MCDAILAKTMPCSGLRLALLQRSGRTLIVSLLTAFVMESVLAMALTMLNNPWDSSFSFVWWTAFSRSIPIGLLIALFMGFYMKPKMDQMRKANLARA